MKQKKDVFGKSNKLKFNWVLNKYTTLFYKKEEQAIKNTIIRSRKSRIIAANNINNINNKNYIFESKLEITKM